MAFLKKKPSQQPSRRPQQTKKLLSAQTRKYIGKTIKLGQLCAWHPFEWNNETDRPEFTTSRLRMVAWLVNAVFCTAYWMFVIVQAIRTNTSENETAATGMFLIFAAVAFLLPTVIDLMYLLTWKQLPECVASFLSYCDEFEDKFIRENAKQTKTSRLSEHFAKFTYVSFLVDGILVFFFAGLARLDGPEQLSWLFQGWPTLQVFTSVVCNFYFGMSVVTNGMTIVLTTFPVLFVLFDVLDELAKEKSNFTNEAFRQPRQRIQVCREVLLFAGTIDRVYGFIHATTKYILMFNGMLCAYGAIRLDGIVSGALAFVGFSLTMNLMAFLNGWSKFYSGSTDALSALVNTTTSLELRENERARAWLRKSIKSLRIARLPIGGMYYIDRGLVLNVLHTIIDGIIFLLVNY